MGIEEGMPCWRLQSLPILGNRQRRRFFRLTAKKSKKIKNLVFLLGYLVLITGKKPSVVARISRATDGKVIAKHTEETRNVNFQHQHQHDCA